MQRVVEYSTEYGTNITPLTGRPPSVLDSTSLFVGFFMR